MSIISNAPAPVDGRADDRIIRDAQRVLVQRVLTHAIATADDVRSTIMLPDGIDPECLEAAPGPLARLGIIRRTGYSEAIRQCAHAQPVSVWELVDDDVGFAWLAAHPPIPDKEGA